VTLEAEPGAPAVQPPPPKRRLGPVGRRRIVLAAAWLCAVLAVVGGSGAAGFWLATQTVVASQPNPEPSVIEVPVGTILQSSSLMPDVRGLDEDGALEVLADAGVEISRVTVTTKPFAGPSDLVIAQSPVFGTVDPGTVELTVSAPAAVPDLSGLTTDEAMDLLIELGARVDQVEIYLPDVPVGFVRSVEPVAGSALPELVVLTVTADPSAVFLSQLKRTGSSCSNDGSMLIDGETFANAISCSSSTSGREVSWQLNKAVDILSGTIGVPDSEDAASSVRVQIIADGVQIALFDVAYGTPQQVDLRLTGVLSLSVIATTLTGSSTELGFGDLSALGASAPIAALPRR